LSVAVVRSGAGSLTILALALGLAGLAPLGRCGEIRASDSEATETPTIHSFFTPFLDRRSVPQATLREAQIRIALSGPIGLEVLDSLFDQIPRRNHRLVIETVRLALSVSARPGHIRSGGGLERLLRPQLREAQAAVDLLSSGEVDSPSLDDLSRISSQKRQALLRLERLRGLAAGAVAGLLASPSAHRRVYGVSLISRFHIRPLYPLLEEMTRDMARIEVTGDDYEYSSTVGKETSMALSLLNKRGSPADDVENAILELFLGRGQSSLGEELATALLRDPAGPRSRTYDEWWRLERPTWAKWWATHS
jgi:hypothetical protein